MNIEEKNKEFFNRKKEQLGINLNAVQEEAAKQNKGQTLLLAVPGSGKTTSMIMNIARSIEVDGYNPKRILAITFSKESAEDMLSRYRKIIDPSIKDSPVFSTIHSFAFRVARDYLASQRINYEVLNDYKRKEFIVKAYNKATNNNVTVFTIEERLYEELELYITLIKNSMSLPSETDVKIEGVTNEELSVFYQFYEQYKMTAKLRYIDFDDMLEVCHWVLSNNEMYLNKYARQYDYVLTDESQDTSIIQHAIVDLLVKEHQNLFVVGDDDQSIYAFRAASLKHLLNMKERYPNIRELYMEQNYRSAPEIVDFSNKFIKINKERYNKEMFTENDLKGHIKLETKSYFEHQDAIIEDLLNFKKDETFNFGEIAILSRSVGGELYLIYKFLKKGIPFYLKKVEKDYFSNFILQDFDSYIKIIQDPTIKNLEEFLNLKVGVKLYLKRSQKEEMLKIAKNENQNKLIVDFLNEQDLLPYQLDSIEMIEIGLSRLAKAKTFKEQLMELVYGRIFNYVSGLSDYTEFTKKNTTYYLNILTFLYSIGIEKSSYEEFKKEINALYEYAINSVAYKETGVNILTIHSSKGLEFKHVYLFLASENNYTKGAKLKIKEEESRLAYVGMTRAKQYLTICLTTEGENTRDMDLINKMLLNNDDVKKEKELLDVARKTKMISDKIQKEIEKESKTNKVKQNKIVKDEVYIEKDMKVHHKKFGEGIVVSSESEILKIDFKGIVKLFNKEMSLKKKIITITQ